MRSLISSTIATLATCTAATAAQSQFSFSELFFNPPGADNGQEYIEISGPSNSSLNGYFILFIEGDGTGAGLIDAVLPLTGLSTGANGLLLWRDSASTINPAPSTSTSVFVSDFVPDIENGSNTYVLATGTAPTAGADIDTNNDGVMDVSVSFVAVDAVSVLENDGTANVGYADDLGFPGALLGPFNGDALIDPHTPDGIVRFYNLDSACGWAGGDVGGTNPGGPYSYVVTTPPTEVFGFAGFGITSGGYVASPGSTNEGAADTDLDGVLNPCDLSDLSRPITSMIGTSPSAMIDVGFGSVPTGPISYKLKSSSPGTASVDLEGGTIDFAFELEVSFPLLTLIGSPPLTLPFQEKGYVTWGLDSNGKLVGWTEAAGGGEIDSNDPLDGGDTIVFNIWIIFASAALAPPAAYPTAPVPYPGSFDAYPPASLPAPIALPPGYTPATAGDVISQFPTAGAQSDFVFKGLFRLPGQPGDIQVTGEGTWSVAPWTNLGGGLTGVAGTPKLSGTGTLVAGTSGSIDLVSAAPNSQTLLLLSFSSSPVPFLGGTLVAVPFFSSIGLATNSSGEVHLPFPAWPAGLPTGTTLFFQNVVVDAAAIHGVSISNALRADTP